MRTILKKQLGDSFHIVYSKNINLVSPDQGEFKLPIDYNPGDFFKGLEVAADIFLNESIGKNGVRQNINYRFGDPVLLENGNYRYPELLEYFTKYGETYAESLKRIFSTILEFSKKSYKTELNTEVVIIGHGFGFHMMRGLSVLSELEVKELSEMSVNELIKKIYQIYKSFNGVLAEMGYFPINISNLKNPALVKVLENIISKL